MSKRRRDSRVRQPSKSEQFKYEYIDRLESAVGIELRYSSGLYTEIMARRSGQGPMEGGELGILMHTLHVIQDDITHYKHDGCLIAAGIGGGEMSLCGKLPLSKNHTIQENGVLNQIAVSRGTEKKVLQFAPDVRHIRDLTKGPNLARGGKPEPTRKPLWRIGEYPPVEVLIGDASVRWFACKECDNSVFDIIDSPPPVSAEKPPIRLQEECLDCVSGGFSDATHSCIEKWLSTLAYRSCLRTVDRLIGVREVGSRFLPTSDSERELFTNKLLIDSINGVSRQLRLLESCRQAFESRRLLCEGPSMEHHILEFRPTVRVASSNFELVRNSNGQAFYALNVYPQADRVLVFISYFRQDERILRPLIGELSREIQNETSSTPGVFLERLLGTLDNTYASPDEYDRVSPEFRRRVARKRADVSGYFFSNLLVSELENHQRGRKVLALLRQELACGLLPKSLY